MKTLQVYGLKNLTPNSVEEYEQFCDLMDVPSLKSGFITVLGDVVSEISAKVFKNELKVSRRIYSMQQSKFLDAVLLVNYTPKRVVIL